MKTCIRSFLQTITLSGRRPSPVAGRLTRRALRPITRIGVGRAGVLLRNLAAYPKGLWLAGIARYWNTDHIHARW